jgi:hypothetical protein
MKQQILDRFNGNYSTFYGKYLQRIKKNSGDEHIALCPFHDDTKPSFSFNSKTGQYYCHGCKTKGDIFTFYGKKHRINGNFPAILQGIANEFGIENNLSNTKGRIVATYNYTDEGGKLLFQKVRYEPKGFAQRRPDGNNKWIYNLKDIVNVPYNLPRILNAEEVCLAEGEKDCDILNKLGFVATTNPGGAGKWFNQFNQYFKNKHVVIFPDNDEVGMNHAQNVAQSLSDAATSIKIIDLPDLKKKEDVFDFITKIGDEDVAKERLALMIENAEPYQPTKKCSFEDAILPVKEFQKLKLPEKEKLLDPWLNLNMIALIVGWRGVGKTWFAMGLIDSVTRGINFGPWKTVKSVPCLYLEAEMPAQDIQIRLNSLNPDSERISPLYVYSDAYANLQGQRKANLLDEEWRNSVKKYLTTRGIKLWVIDNLASITPGIDENVKKDWDQINKWLLELRFYGISTVLLHHANKAGEQRGTSAREDNIDISIMLKKPHNYLPEEGARFLAKFEKQRIPTADLPKIADTQFHLTQDEKGQLVWTFGDFKKETKKEVLIHLDEGMKQNEVAELLGISNGRVSQIRKWGIKENYMTETNKLTQEGFIWVN